MSENTSYTKINSKSNKDNTDNNKKDEFNKKNVYRG
jgi:hypothetical protein